MATNSIYERLQTNPTVTFNRVIAQSTTPSQRFIVESVQSLNFGQTKRITIGKDYDLLSGIFLEFTLPALNQTQTSGASTTTYQGWTNSLVFAIIDEISIKIGDDIIDKHNGTWLDIISELDGLEESISNSSIGKYNSRLAVQSNGTSTKILRIPLKFWFNNNTGLALPLFLINEMISLEIKTKNSSTLTKTDVVNITDPQNSDSNSVSITSFKLLYEYINISEEEKTRMRVQRDSANGLEYMIRQLQIAGINNDNITSTSLNYTEIFDYPLSEIIWVFQNNNNITENSYTGNDWFNYSAGSISDGLDNSDIFDTVRIRLNDTQLYDYTSYTHFKIDLPGRYHQRVPKKNIYVLPFSNSPESFQPSGNSLSLDNSETNRNTFQMDFILPSSSNTFTLKMFAVNYNILTIHKNGSISLYNN